MSLTTRVKIFCLFCFALALGVAAVNTGASASQPTLPAATPAQKIDAQVLADTANGQSASFVALLSDQANLSAAYTMTDSDARGWYVYNTLRTQADQTQAGLRALLNARGAHYQSYWAANMLVVTGDRTLVDTLAARSDIKAIESNRPFRAIEDPAVLNATPSTAAAPNAPEWGVQNVNAPQVWALGFTGQGIVIANQDTGMQWDHPALKPHYRGWNGTVADHNYNWHDSHPRRRRATPAATTRRPL